MIIHKKNNTGLVSTKLFNILCITLIATICVCSLAIASYESAKYAVILDEYIDGTVNKNLSSCENAIEKELADIKYHVVNNKFVNSFDDTKAFAELVGSEESGSDTEIKLSTQKIIKNTKADILIVGEANVALLSEDPIQQTQWASIYSARASGLFKVIEVKTGKVLFTVNEMQSGADVSTSTAYEKALSNLGQQVGRKIVEKMLINEE